MNETHEALDEAQTSVDVGTSDNGQSSDSQQSKGTPNDPNAFQADYTRKYEELAEERRKLEAERHQMYSLMQSRQQQHEAPAQNQSVDLSSTFGQEAASALHQFVAPLTQQLQQQQLQTLYMQELLLAKDKFGSEEIKKYDYTDPQTGLLRNKILDARMRYNPLTNQATSLEEAYAAVKYSDPKSRDQMKAELRAESMKELEGKSQATPKTAGASPSTQQAQSSGRFRSIKEAFKATQM